jgi:peptidyl-prolyl cis-trans isomerase C
VRDHVPPYYNISEREVLLIAIAAFLLIFLAALSPQSASAQEDPVLATVNGKVLMRVSDFERIIGYYDAEKQEVLRQNPQFKATILERIVQAAVISQMARNAGFDKRAEVKEQLELLSNDFLASEYLRKGLTDTVTVTDEDVKIYYQAHKEEFGTPETVKARHILVAAQKSATEDERKAAREKAEGLQKRARSGEDFAKLAAEYSDDPASKTRGGDLGFFTKGRMVPEFEKAAFSLKPGEISDVIETPLGYHIIKVEEKKEAVQQPFDKVKDQAREKALAEAKKAKAQDAITRAVKDQKVEINYEPIAQKK